MHRPVPPIRATALLVLLTAASSASGSTPTAPADNLPVIALDPEAPLSTSPRGETFVALWASLPEAFAVRQVRRDGDRLLVETGVNLAGTCHTSPVPSSLALRFWVPATAVRPVTARPVVRTGALGTLTLPPGTAVVMHDEGPFNATLHAYGVRVALHLDPADLTTTLTPTPRTYTSGPSLGDLTPQALDSEAFSILLDGRKRVAAVGTERRVDVGCASWALSDAVSVPAGGIQGGVVGGIGGSSSRPEPVMLPAGTRLTWDDGTPAGTVVTDHKVVTPMRRPDGQICFGERLGNVHGDQRLTLCVAR